LVNHELSGQGRRTLSMIDYYPEPKEILAKILDPETDWPYRSERRGFLIARDRALAAVLYNAELRISEAERLTKGQFKADPFRIIAVKLSKAEKFSKATGKVITRKDLYRKEIRLASKGTRGKISQLIQEYLDLLDNDEDLLFNIKNCRVDGIIKGKLGVPPHWLRAFGENELYGLWDNDLIAVANHVQVDPRTLAKYIHRTPEKYLNRE
jgi:integrase